MMYGAGTIGLLFVVVLISGSSSGATAALPVESPVATTIEVEETALKSGGEGAQQAAVVAETMSADASPDADVYSAGQYDLIYNVFSLAIAAMGSATVFFFFQFSLVDKEYRTAMVLTGLVTLIAFYHYLRIFNSFTESYKSVGGVVSATGVPFNDAYRYVDWLLTVPLLLSELILVMGLPAHETRARCFSLGSLAAVMVLLGYPGEISAISTTRWIFWALAMVPFCIIVFTLVVGLAGAIEQQPSEARGLVSAARYITVVSWCTYPVVFLFPMLGLTGCVANTAVQVGYSVADIIAKPILGLVCWMIASAKSGK